MCARKMEFNIITKHVTFQEVIEQKKDRHKGDAVFMRKTFKMASFPAVVIILRAGVGNDAKMLELLWENCILALKMMTEVK